MGTYTFSTLQEFYDFQDRASAELIDNMTLDSTVNPYTITWDSGDDSEANQIITDIQNNVPAPAQSFSEVSAAIAGLQNQIDGLDVPSTGDLNQVESTLSSQIDAIDTRVEDLEAKSISLTKENVYEYMDIWAEEGGTLSNGSSQWSFGNGATGNIGLAMSNGWEVIGMGFSCDNYSASTWIEVECIDYVSGNSIAYIELINANDGGGSENNARKYEDLTGAPSLVPNDAILGFRTVHRTGYAADGRVSVRLRRLVGEFVTDVTLD